MVINTGSRTDIPAYYSRWFYNRIREGFVFVRNPYNPEQVTRYRLTQDVVDCLAFCTKNPEPMLERLGELEGFRQLWFVTITPYGKEIEPHVPDKARVMEVFKRLSKAVGRQAVGWRYDPIFIDNTYSLEFHLERFEQMAEKLSGYTDYCIISFIDLYQKTKRNFPGVREVTREERQVLGREFVRIGKKYLISIKSCCEGEDLKPWGVDTSGCMTKEVIERATGLTLSLPGRKQPARKGCACLLGDDIGVYNTCGHGCLYCYANEDREQAAANVRYHDPDSPLLAGRLLPGEKVLDAEQVSWADGQMRLPFDI